MLLILAGFVVLLVLLLLGVPFIFAMGLAGLAGIVYIHGWSIAINSIATYAMSYTASYSLAAIPLFIMMGTFASAAMISDDVFEVAYNWVGRLPGGLASSTIGACAMFGAVTGSSQAAVGALGEMAMKEMRARHYDAPMSAACIAASSSLGGLIPPSIIAVIYGSLMESSIGRQLMAGLIPGLLTALLYMIMIMSRATFFPRVAPAAKGITWRESLSSLPKLWSAVLVFVVVMGGIYMGLFTPTEAAALGLFVAIVLALLRTGFHWNPLKTALTGGLNITGMIFALLIGASAFKLFASLTGASQAAAAYFAGLHVSKEALTLLLLVPYLPLGMFIDTISIMLLTLPIYLTILQQTGINIILFGVLVTKLCGIAYLSPPLGINILLIRGISPDIPIMHIFKEGAWFILMDMIVVVLILMFPQIALWLPSMIFEMK